MVELFTETGSGVILLKLKRDINKFNLVRILFSIFKKDLPDVLHVQYIAPGFLPILAGRIARVKVIFATVHQPGTPYPIIYKIFLRIASRLTTRLLCVSQSVEKSWFGNSSLYEPGNKLKPDRRHATIYNGVDTSKLDEIKLHSDSVELKKKYNLLNCLVIGAVARMRYEKGIDILIRVFESLAKDLPNARLVLVGNGPELDSYRCMVASLNIQDKVTFTGAKSWKSAMEHLLIMDVVVCPSRFEGFGLTAVEAMSMGKLVIANKVDGLKEIIIDQVTGILLETKDKQKFLSSIGLWLPWSEQKESIVNKAVSEVRKKFSYGEFATNITSLYNLTILSKDPDD